MDTRKSLLNFKDLIFISHHVINDSLERVSNSIEIIKSDKNMSKEGVKNLELGVQKAKSLLKNSRKDSIASLKNIIDMTSQIVEPWNLGAYQTEHFSKKQKK